MPSDAPYVLHMFTPGKQISPFDANMAADAGHQILVPYCEVGLDAVTALTQDAIFSRGPKGAARTGIFIGGRDALLASDMLDRAAGAMFKPFIVSLMADPSGAYTTAAAMVACVEAGLRAGGAAGLAAQRVVVLGGTGPVGRIAGVLAAQSEAAVTLVSHSSSAKARQAASETSARFGVALEAGGATTPDELHAVLAHADVVLACAAAGVQVVSADDLAHATRVRVLADLNAVPPEGIAGVGVMDKGKPVAGSAAVGYGALAVGDLKYKTQHRMLVQMRESEQRVRFGFAEAFAAARAIVAESAAR